MSLVPFHSHEGREIVLRHRNAIVVRDPFSQRLEIRGIQECPTCHRPLRSSSSPHRASFASSGSDAAYDDYGHARHEGYVDPDYFRMLRVGHQQQLRAAGVDVDGGDGSSIHSVPDTRASPLRRFIQPFVGQVTGRAGSHSTSRATSTSSAALSDDEDGLQPRPGSSPTPLTTTMPASEAASPIRKEAFSPHYFKSFFVEERELGRGGKGVVLLVRHEIDGCQLGHFACKRVPVGDDHAWLEKVLIEVELLAKLSHPNLVSYRHVWLENVTLTRFGPSVACAFILQQYCNGGDLQNYILGDQPKEATKEELKAQMRRRSRGQAERPANPFAKAASSASVATGGRSPFPHHPHRLLQFDEIFSLFRDITSGLAYLHAANYIHRDLKPSNCLLHREGHNLTCLISDFGEVQPENVARRSTGTTGTISYCAPEVLRRGSDGVFGNFTTKSDIFSLGMILYFMCFGCLPYRSANSLHEELEDVAQLRAEISAWRGFQYERRLRPDLPSKLYQLLTRLLAVNPADRPGASDVLLAMRTTESAAASSSAAAAATGGSGASPATSTAMGPPLRRFQNASRVDDLDEEVITDSDNTSPAPSIRATHHRGLQKRTSSTLTLRRSPERREAAARQSPSDLDGGAGSSADDGVGLGIHDRLSPDIGPISRPSSPRKRRRSPSPSLSPSLSLGPLAKTPSAPSAASPLPTPPPPMLMAPPMTWSDGLRQRGLLAQYHLLLYVHRNAESVGFLFRATLFLAKMATLSRPCWPFMARWSVGAPLVVVAGLDLGLPGGSGGSSGNRNGRRAPQQSALSWRWGWRVSVLLLVLHMVVLWVAAQSEVLCAGSSRHEAWAEW